MYSYSKTTTGLKSNVNEDSFYSSTDKSEQVYLLCDGMGGHPAGDIASRLCIKYFLEEYSSMQSLLTTTKNVNRRLREYASAYPDCHRMGTTLIGLFLKKDIAEIVSVGDSRIYLFTAKDFEQLTEDQSPVWELFAQGMIEKDDIITHPRKNIIKEAIGLHDEPAVNLYRVQYPSEHWIFLLCSDGLTDVTTDSEIHNVLKQAKSLKEGVEGLSRVAIQNKSRDDITITLVSNYLE